MARWTAFLGGGSSDEDGGGLGAIGLIIMSILAPLAAMVIQMAISRSGEYRADATGARFAGHSEGLARALEKLGRYSRRLPLEANPSTAHMVIVNPLTAKNLTRLFSTHPPLEERIARLRGGHAEEIPGNSEDRGREAAEETWKSLSR
jgi:heat shock protein HtpX